MGRGNGGRGRVTGAIEGKFTLNFLRKESSDRDNVRIEVELPNPKGEEPQQFAFGYNGAANWAAKDRQPTVLTPEAQTSFLASLVHDYMALLRFREDGAKVERLGDERVAGIDTVVLELTHRDGSKTKYFISGKTYRILHLEYEVKPTSDKSVKLRESFYDFRAVQNVLVPMRKVLYEDSKFKQEIELKEVRYKRLTRKSFNITDIVKKETARPGAPFARCPLFLS